MPEQRDGLDDLPGEFHRILPSLESILRACVTRVRPFMLQSEAYVDFLHLGLGRKLYQWWLRVWTYTWNLVKHVLGLI